MTVKKTHFMRGFDGECGGEIVKIKVERKGSLKFGVKRGRVRKVQRLSLVRPGHFFQNAESGVWK